jgi:hypothetical protein
MLWREFATAVTRLYGPGWRAKLAADLYDLFRIDQAAISRWEDCRWTIPLHVELALRSRLFIAARSPAWVSGRGPNTPHLGGAVPPVDRRVGHGQSRPAQRSVPSPEDEATPVETVDQ